MPRPFPKEAVRSSEELRALFDEYWPQLRERALMRFASERAQDVDLAMSRVRARMEEHGGYDHPLQQLLNYVRVDLRTLARRRRAREKWLHPGEELDDVLIDPVIGRLEGARLEAVMKLPRKSRETMLRTARGESPADIARSEGRSPGVVRVRLAKARARVLGGSLPAFLPLLWPRRWIRLFLESPPVSALAPIIAIATLNGLVPTVLPSVDYPTEIAYHAPTLPSSHHQEDAQVSAPTALATPTGTVHVSAPVIPLHGAAAETPEDVRLTAVGTRGIHVVAIGVGKQCQCRVLMRSDDGGATWVATDGPPKAVSQIVLPKSYPADPRIFGGTDPHGTSPPAMTASFGSSWQLLVKLPPGNVAISSNRIYVAAVGGVWSTDGVSVRQEVATPTDQITMSISAVADDGWVWAPAGAAPGTLNVWTVPVLLHCDPTCSVVTAMQENPGVLGDGYAYSLSSYYAINGSQVTTLAVHAVITAAGQGWIATNTSGVSSIERLVNGSWLAVGQDDSIQTHGVLQMAQLGQSVMVVLANAGYRCWNGTNWLPRCPKA